ncbi:MAG: sialidase family protein [Methylophilaceae bacterium]|nr:sialidase family protein [Methylophilaceae bacterium]MDG1452938.1 sialidase family protein [Methylophilaceae bacterium]
MFAYLHKWSFNFINKDLRDILVSLFALGNMPACDEFIMFYRNMINKTVIYLIKNPIDGMNKDVDKGFLMRFLIAILSFVLVTSAPAHEAKPNSTEKQLAISLATDEQGQLWRAEIIDGFVAVSMSEDLGKTFSKPVCVNLEKQKLSAKGEVRPKIALGTKGEVYVAWMQNLTKRFAGYIWFSRSLDGGKSFEKPIIVHQDRAEIGHAFEELSVSADGKVTVLWLDARDLMRDKLAGKKRSGSSIYYTTSSDKGDSFAPEVKLADYSCECCRIATTTKPDGTVVAMWRHVFDGGERDHMMAEIPQSAESAELHRATFGHWQLDGCPHHGGALAIGGEDANWWGYHMAYFDGKEKNPGLYYSRMDGEAWVTSPAKQFGDNNKQAGHPTLLSSGEKVWLAWQETHAGNVKKVMGMSSNDGGKTWSDATNLLSTSAKIDYSQLLKFKDATYLVVNTSEGLKLKIIP